MNENTGQDGAGTPTPTRQRPAQAGPSDGSTPAYYVLIAILLIVIASGSAILLATIWATDPKSETLGFEAAKACMQVLSVALVGGIVSYAVFTLQRNRERRELALDKQRADQQRETDRLLENQRQMNRQIQEDYQRNVDRARAEYVRKIEHARDVRQRRDELLRSCLDVAVSNYNVVKRSRRILRARIWLDNESERIDLSVYDEQMAIINDAQLNFELLKRTSPLIMDDRIKQQELRPCFKSIEAYLGTLIGEYETNRRKVVSNTSGSEIPKLREFFESRSDPFRAGIAKNIDEIIDQLRAALLTPLELPILESNLPQIPNA